MLDQENRELKDKFLLYYRQLPIQKLAAASIAKDEDTIIRWRKQDSDFADQVQNAKAEWAMEKAKGVKSTEWILERVMKDHFAPRQELTGKEGEKLEGLVIVKNGNTSEPVADNSLG